MARHAVRGCINACGIKHSARAQAIMPLLSRRPALAGPHRRGDQMSAYFAAGHESGCGRYCCKSRRGSAVEFKFETIESGRAHF
jgi:hypothetical protein